MISLLRALMWFAVGIYCLSFWALMFLQTWIFLLSAAAGILVMFIGAWLANQEQNDCYDYRP